MEIIENRAIVEDAWRHLSDDEELPADGRVIVSLARLVRDREALLRRGEIGVRLAPDAEIDAIAGDLDRLGVVAVQFPKFTDGRGYSLARLVRERHGYRGQLRAVGDVLRDQLFYLHRCGFDAFELAPGKSLSDALAAFGELSVTYQGAADDPRPLFRRRSA